MAKKARVKANDSFRFRAFFNLDDRSLALFRIAIAVLVLLDIVARSHDLSAFYTDEGLLPRHVLHNLTSKWQLSLHDISGHLYYELGLFVLTGVLALFMLAGYFTTLSTTLCWVLIASLHVRNPIVLNAGDTYLRMLVFWSIFLPLANTWSVDACRRARQSRLHALDASPIASSNTHVISSLGCIALSLQVVLVYLTAGIPKAWVHSWQVGDAIRIALSKEHLVTPFGTFLLNFPRLLWFLSYSTLALEIIGPILLVLASGWFRLCIIVVFVVFHIGLALCFSIGLFPFVCIAALIAFLPPQVWSRVRAPAAAPSTRMPSWRNTDVRRFKGHWNPRTSDGLGRMASTAILSMALLITAWSCLGSISRACAMPPILHRLGYALKWNQTWQMFVSLKGDEPRGWYVVHGQLRNGQSINLLTGEGAVSYDKPDRVGATYANFRWRKIYSRARKRSHRHMRTALGRYHRRLWDASHEPNEHIERLRIYYVQYKDHDTESLTAQSAVTVFGDTYPTNEPVKVTRLYSWRDPRIALTENNSKLKDLNGAP